MAQDTLLGFPAHTLHPQGVCSIRSAAEPLAATLPFRRGEFTTLSTVFDCITVFFSPQSLICNLLPPVPKAVLLQHSLALLPAAGIVKFDILQGVNIRHDIPLPPRLVNGDEVIAHIVEDPLP